MAKYTIFHNTLTKSILYALSFFILIVFLRVLLIFIPPVIVHASPNVIRVGQVITLWGFMGSQNIRDASTLMLNNVPVEDVNIQQWNFFSIRFRITEQDTQRLKKNAHGIVYLQYKNYRSTRFLISLSHDNGIKQNMRMVATPSLSMRNKETVYPKDNLVFSLTASQSHTNPIFIEEYSFRVKTKSAMHTVYPHEWNTFSDNAIEFAVPVSFFPIPPKESVRAEIQVMYKNTIVSTHYVLLAVPSILSSAAYEFEVELAYDTTSEKYSTMIVPLSRLWQRVRFSDKRIGAKEHISDEQFHTAISQGFIKNFTRKKLSFLVTRYPFHTFDWKNLSALEERATFSSFAHKTEEELPHATLAIPHYLQNSNRYFNEVLYEIISRSIDDVRERTSSVEDLITYFFHEAERIVSDAAKRDASRIFQITDGEIRRFSKSFKMPQVFHSAKMLAITAELLRSYGIPAQVVIGFFYNKEKETAEKLHMKPAVWLEVFTSSYGVIPLRVTKRVSTFSIMPIDYRFVGYTILEHMIYLTHRNQKPNLPTELRSFILRN